MEVRWRCIGWKYGDIMRVSRLSPSNVEQKHCCGQMFQLIFTDGGWNFALMCRRASEYEPLLQLISLNLA